MQVEKHDVGKSAVELVIKIETREFEPYEKKAFEKLEKTQENCMFLSKLGLQKGFH